MVATDCRTTSLENAEHIEKKKLRQRPNTRKTNSHSDYERENLTQLKEYNCLICH